MNDPAEKDENKFGTRLKRYGQVTGTMAGLAAKLAGEKYLGLKIERDDHAAQLTQALGNMKGPLMKVGQILSTIPEALPAEYAQAFQELQANAPPMGWPFVKRRMKTELGADWESKFKSFEKQACNAASLGQVHKALADIDQLKKPPKTLTKPASKKRQKEMERNSNIPRTGSVNVSEHTCEPEAQEDLNCSPFIEDVQLACKLQYPDMRSAIDADLQQLKIIFSMYERYDKSIQTKNIHEELSERLQEELDYALEARHAKLYAYMLKGEKGVHIPEIIDELSTDRLLTSTWLEGDKIMNFIDGHADQRNELAMNMFRAWYVPLYNYGVIHGDPHLGNYTVRPDNSINLLDFGCVRVFPPEFIGGVIDLYTALMTNDMALAVHAYETWGFKNLSKEQVETLNMWAGFLYGPVMEDKIRPIGEVSGGVYGRDTAEKVHTRLRELSRDNGGVSIPREFVFMDRAALGLGSVFLHLKAEINWYRVFNELIQGFDLETLRARQTAALKKFDVPLPRESA